MNGELRFSRPGDEQELKGLWKVTFGDLDEYIDGFFSHMYLPGKALVYECNGKIVSAAYMLDIGKMPKEDGGAQVSVTYAFSTLPEYRSRGIGRLIANKAAEAEIRNGECVICPAEPSLFRYYGEKCGYITCFFVRDIVGGAANFGKTEKVNAEKYMDIRERLLAPRAHIVHSRAAVKYQEYLCEMAGGGLYAVTVDGMECCAAVEVYGGKAVIKELLAPEGLERKAGAGAAYCAGAEKFTARVPAGSIKEARPFAMAVPNTAWKLRTGLPAWLGFSYD